MSHRIALRKISPLCQCLRSTSRPQATHLRTQLPKQRNYTTRQIPSPSSNRTRHNTLLPLSAITLACLAAYTLHQPSPPHLLDARPSPQGSALTSGARVQITGQDHGDDIEKAPTGTTTIPHFPKSIWLPASGPSSSNGEGKSAALPAGTGAAEEEEEYALLGLGVRKVSLFRIEVYIVGIYVAKSDVGKLQEELVKASVGVGASTLVQGEKEALRKTLLSGEGSERVWGEVLRQGGVRSAVRIVPVKKTDFGHLRQGWLRGIDARGKGGEFSDEGLKGAVERFKEVMGERSSVEKGRVLLLGRGGDGVLRAWREADAAVAMQGDQGMVVGKGERMKFLGSVEDERISRLVWMGYLSGENPASEQARQSVVDGVIDIVERPIGTVETQVV